MGNQASVKVFRPTHVHADMHQLWHEVATHLANKGRLLTASRRVDYNAINQGYLRVLGSALQMGRKAAATRVAMTQKVAAGAKDVPIATPKHVPVELRPVWFAAARHASRKGRLLTASRTLDYQEINRNYMRAVASFIQKGQEANPAPTQRKASTTKPWPFSDITPVDIGKMAAAGRWDQVERAAKLASKVQVS